LDGECAARRFTIEARIVCTQGRIVAIFLREDSPMSNDTDLHWVLLRPTDEEYCNVVNKSSDTFSKENVLEINE
jgi:hypothetical protein